MPGGPFLPGTTMSHVDNSDAVLSPGIGACDASGVTPLTSDDARVLDAVGVRCNAPSGITDPDYGALREAGEGPSTAQTPLLPADPSGSARRRTGSRSQATAAIFLWSCSAAWLASR